MNDPELMWDLLSNNHARLAHAWGQELAHLSQRSRRHRFHRRANECLQATLSWPAEARSRAVKTWLSTYKIPLDSSKLECFDQFHDTTGQFVIDHAASIQSYK